MRRSARIEIRITPEMADKLKAEASVLGVSLNAYLRTILVFRKHARRAFTEQEIIASGD